MITEIKLKQGEARDIEFTYTDSLGSVIDVSSDSFYYVVKNSSDNVILKKEDTDFDKLHAISGIVSFNVSSVDSSIEAGIYNSEIKRTVNITSEVNISNNIEFIIEKSLSSDVINSGEVTISDLDINLIKAALAYPVADDILLSDDEIKAFCVYPALLEYYTKFPIIEKHNEYISSDTELTIDFPDNYTFGAVDARIIDKFSTTTSSSSSFWELVNWEKYGYGSSAGLYGIKGYNPGSLRQANFTQYQAKQAQQKYTQIVTIRVDPDNRNVKAYTNITGQVYVEWAKYSLNFNNIRFQQRMNVVKLCQYYLLRHLADTSSIIADSNLDISINSDELKTKADELREQVTEVWEQYNDIILIKT
ncbi:MAG: hypothetical protein GY853_09860 [PVC group bacterium]|nr:hypothetical protein [PVC group bacterium]